MGFARAKRSMDDDEIVMAIAATEATWDAAMNDTPPCNLDQTAAQLGYAEVTPGVWEKCETCPKLDGCDYVNRILID